MQGAQEMPGEDSHSSGPCKRLPFGSSTSQTDDATVANWNIKMKHERTLNKETPQQTPHQLTTELKGKTSISNSHSDTGQICLR
jgi:hypothetical protein